MGLSIEIGRPLEEVEAWPCDRLDRYRAWHEVELGGRWRHEREELYWGLFQSWLYARLNGEAKPFEYFVGKVPPPSEGLPMEVLAAQMNGMAGPAPPVEVR